MNNQVNLIDADMLLECLKKEAEFCIKEKFNENNTRFYLGRETVLTDIIKQIESGAFAIYTPPVPTIKPGDKVRHTKYGYGDVKKISACAWVWFFDGPEYKAITPDDLEVVE
ncbi:hypothetical protein [Paenibacillus glucanolyticus]|uniref:hypothetical protein n=1 Tax=Paenibacillus glucanolyticus TaxID=59843 RepID=UPI00128D2E82|nr:hypothetical protein [Paenibacillus glucanolyticus]MPY20277.1 hypothetical protein [Paenibacillus glucanolyticus]